MSARGTQLLAKVFDPGDRKPSWAPGAGRASMASALAPPRDASAKLAPSSKRRTQIWELHQSLHCSIIGTCLSSGELRRLLVRLEVQGAETADDHDLHILGVLLAGRAGAKQLQKALDRRHQAFLNQFAKAKDATALSALWEDALARGDIPGAYWALLTHPAATDAMVKDVFGQVHMLSHLVGAANRADIRRLRQLEEDNAALAAKLERAQRQLRDGFTSRNESIRRLNDMLARAASQEAMVASLEAAEDSKAVRTRSRSSTNAWPTRPAGARVSSSGWRALRPLSTRPSARASARKARSQPCSRSWLRWNPGWAPHGRARTPPPPGSTCTA